MFWKQPLLASLSKSKNFDSSGRGGGKPEEHSARISPPKRDIFTEKGEATTGVVNDHLHRSSPRSDDEYFGDTRVLPANFEDNIRKLEAAVESPRTLELEKVKELIMLYTVGWRLAD